MGTDWIQTFSGRRFFPLEPRAEELDVADIAHALSLLCRFNGHCLRFYSVAEHSLRVSKACPPEYTRWGLMHDAAEAYLSDLPRPIKQCMPFFRDCEDRLLRVIADRYDLGWPMPVEVAAADTRLLATEARDLMVAPPASWELGQDPLPERIEPLGPAEAETAFLARFEELS